MGWLHGVEGGRVSNTCRHGVEGFCRRCEYPTAEEIAADKLAAEQAAEREAEKAAADEQAAKELSKKEADFIASRTPYELACWEGRWEDAYALLPEICYLHVQDSDGYPPPPKREKKPTFSRYWEVMTSGWREYRIKGD